MSDKYDYPVSRSAQPLWKMDVRLSDGRTIPIGGTTNQAREDLLALGEAPTAMQIGRWAEKYYTSPFLVDGCATGLTVMAAIGLAQAETVRVAIREGTCCGHDTRGNGRCFLVPELVCPLVRAAGKIVREESGE